MRRLILLAVALLALTSCAPDPRKQAEADATRIEAEQRAADAQQRREQEAAEHTQRMQDRDAAQTTTQQAMQDLIRAAALFGQLVLAMWMLALGVAGGYAIYTTSRAWQTYTARRAEVLANLIHLDPKTRQYPLLLAYIGNGKYSLTDPNTDSVLLLDTRNDADRAKVISAANVLHSGALAQEARMSHRPGEVANITPIQVIDPEEVNA